jgi:Tfp pilus assembly protein PilO
MIDVIILAFLIPYRQNKLFDAISQYTVLRNTIKKEGLLDFKEVFKKKEALGEFEKRLRSDKDFPKLIRYLFEQSAVSKVELMNINYTFEEKKDVRLKKVTLNITVDGEYEGIRRFIYTLEKGTYFFEISGTKIIRKPPMVSANIILHTYLKEDVNG